jgi:hypothetical protein
MTNLLDVNHLLIWERIVFDIAEMQSKFFTRNYYTSVISE